MCVALLCHCYKASQLFLNDSHMICYDVCQEDKKDGKDNEDSKKDEDNVEGSYLELWATEDGSLLLLEQEPQQKVEPKAEEAEALISMCEVDAIIVVSVHSVVVWLL